MDVGRSRSRLRTLAHDPSRYNSNNRVDTVEFQTSSVSVRYLGDSTDFPLLKLGTEESLLRFQPHLVTTLPSLNVHDLPHCSDAKAC